MTTVVVLHSFRSNRICTSVLLHLPFHHSLSLVSYSEVFLEKELFHITEQLCPLPLCRSVISNMTFHVPSKWVNNSSSSSPLICKLILSYKRFHETGTLQFLPHSITVELFIFNLGTPAGSTSFKHNAYSDFFSLEGLFAS